MLFKLYSFLHFQSWRIGLWTPPDRKFLTKTLFSEVAAKKGKKRILFVGVHSYTKTYSKYFPQDYFVTMDFDPDLAKYGSQFHICDNLLNIDKYKLGKFDFVFMNGVIGYGLNQEAEIERAFELLSQHMEPGAKMYLGTNPHLTSEKQIENISSLNANFSKVEMIRFKQPYIKNIFHEFRSYQRKEVLC